MESITGLCYLDENGRYQTMELPASWTSLNLFPPRKVVFLTGVNRLYSWKLPEVVSTRVPFASAWWKAGAYHSFGSYPWTSELTFTSMALRTCAYSTVLLITTTNGLKNYWTYSGNIRTSVSSGDSSGSPFRRIKQELSVLPKGLLHLEAGIQSLKESVLQQSRRIGKLSDALEGLKYLCSLKNMETHADLISRSPTLSLIRDIRRRPVLGR